MFPSYIINLISSTLFTLLQIIALTKQGIIEGDQIEVAAFCLESFAYLTGLVTANHNAGSNSARARRLIQIEPCFLPIGYM